VESSERQNRGHRGQFIDSSSTCPILEEVSRTLYSYLLGAA
jgi:hypothetical protein